MAGDLWHYTADRDQDHPQVKKMQKSKKWLSEEDLQIAVNEEKQKGRRKVQQNQDQQSNLNYNPASVLSAVKP